MYYNIKKFFFFAGKQLYSRRKIKVSPYIQSQMEYFSKTSGDNKKRTTKLKYGRKWLKRKIYKINLNIRDNNIDN